MRLPAAGTLLFFSETGIPLFSSRGVEQTFELVEQNAAPEYDINGYLIDMSLPQFNLYETTIVCRDQRPPANDGVFRGKVLTVHCAGYLQYKPPASPTRSLVPGTTAFVNGDFRMYRPVLNCRLVDMSNAFAEWEATNTWRMKLRETKV